MEGQAPGEPVPGGLAVGGFGDDEAVGFVEVEGQDVHADVGGHPQGADLVVFPLVDVDVLAPGFFVVFNPVGFGGAVAADAPAQEDEFVDAVVVNVAPQEVLDEDVFWGLPDVGAVFLDGEVAVT